MIEWPETIEIPDELLESAEQIALDIENSRTTHQDEMGLNIFGTGDGRIVFDVTEYANIPTVLRVAHNTEGVRETRKEATSRNTFSGDLKNRAVPVYQHDECEYRWSFQPKCDPVPFGERFNAEDEISILVEQQGFDAREAYIENIGLWEGTTVVYDYGGILPQTLF